MRTLVLSALLLLTPSIGAAPIARFDAGGTGFIDDAFALSDDGKAVAFITTDGATAAVLHFANIGDGETKVEGAPLDAVSIDFVGLDRVLLVHGSEHNRFAGILTPRGAEKPRLGPFDRLALARLEGKPAIVTYARSEKKAVQHELTAYDLIRLRALRHATLVEDSEGQIRQPRGVLKPLWWSDGFTVLHASKPGEYDKARDIRQPDRYTRLDVFAGKPLVEEQVKDVLALTRIALVRRDHPNEAALARFSDDRKQLLVLDQLAETEMPLTRPIWKYDPQSLASQVLDDGRIAVSLTVDPVNPDAVNRQKSEADDFDLYVFDRRAHTAARVLTLPGQGRRATWQIAGGRIALLRKGKGFDRGGVALEIYDLPTAPSTH